MYKIYKITNTVNEKIYVGKTKQKLESRFKNHIDSAKRNVNRHLYDSMNHYGYDKFIIECLEEVTEFEADNREKFWINYFKCCSPYGYNMTIGGGGGYTLKTWSEEKRKGLYEQQASKRKNRKRTPEQRERMSSAAKLRQELYTPEQRKMIAEKISQTLIQKGIRPPGQYINKPGCEGFFKGKRHKSETKEILRAHRKNKTYEDVYKDINRAKEVKNNKSEKWKSSGNPNYVNFSDVLKNTIIDYLIDNKIKMYEIEIKFEISQYKLRDWMRKELLISNYQILYNQMNDVEWGEFWNAYKN